MKFLYKDSLLKKITDQIQLNEYCHAYPNLPIDGALSLINGSLGPKINKTFSELFFVISGSLNIEVDGIIHKLNAKDMYIVPPGTKHKLWGNSCEIFIACTPAFNLDNVEFCD